MGDEANDARGGTVGCGSFQSLPSRRPLPFPSGPSLASRMHFPSLLLACLGRVSGTALEQRGGKLALLGRALCKSSLWLDDCSSVWRQVPRLPLDSWRPALVNANWLN